MQTKKRGLVRKKSSIFFKYLKLLTLTEIQKVLFFNSLNFLKNDKLKNPLHILCEIIWDKFFFKYKNLKKIFSL